MAAADTIRGARAEGNETGSVSAPIYLGDSMQLRYDTGTLSASLSIELETRETLPGHTEPIIFSIPKELARHQTDIDQLISELATAIDEGRDTEHVADAYEMSDTSRRSVQTIAAAMRELHAADRNHVWAYYIRNMIRPAVIAEQKVDRIIGNPPWLTYSQSADIIRTELREMSERRYQIWAVMPHSALRTGQHLKWRGGNYKRKGGRNAPTIALNFRVQEPWDLDSVVPDFFPMPASVVFAQYTGVGQNAPLAPGTGGDAAFAKPELYEYLEQGKMTYAIRLPANQVIQEQIQPLLERPTEWPSREPLVSYHDFAYQAQSWHLPRRVVAKVEWHQGELFPRVGFIVTNLSYPPKGIVRFYNGRGTAEQWIKEGKYALNWTRLSCHKFVANQVRLWLFVLTYNLGNFMRRLVLPEPRNDEPGDQSKEPDYRNGDPCVHVVPPDPVQRPVFGDHQVEAEGKQHRAARPQDHRLCQNE